MNLSFLLGHLACLCAAADASDFKGSFAFAPEAAGATAGFAPAWTAGVACWVAMGGGATGFADAEGDTGGVVGLAPATGADACDAAFGRSVKMFWHFGQRTLSDGFPRNTASGMRIGAWHLLQSTRTESAGGAGGAAAGACAGTGAGP